MADAPTVHISCTSECCYRCPVCNGNGLVAAGFYNQTSGAWSSCGGTEECRACKGKGYVIQSKIIQELQSEIEYFKKNVIFLTDELENKRHLYSNTLKQMDEYKQIIYQIKDVCEDAFPED